LLCPRGFYVLRLEYCQNKFGEGNVGPVQSVFKRRWKSLDLPSQPALALLAIIVNDDLGSFETPSLALSLLSGIRIRTVMKGECTFAYAIAFCWVSKNRSMTMAFRSIASRPHERAALRLITAGPLSTATHSASGFTTIGNFLWIDGAMPFAEWCTVPSCVVTGSPSFLMPDGE
jgi:hypothetical protein